MMTRNRWWRNATILALAVVAGTEAWAGKGKPGGGGTAPKQELAYSAIVTSGRNVVSRPVVRVPIDGSASQVVTTASAQRVAWAPGGGALAVTQDDSLLSVVETATGDDTPVHDASPEWIPWVTWSGRRDAGGAFLPYDQQALVLSLSLASGPAQCGGSLQPKAANLYLVSGDPTTAPNAPGALTTFGWSEETLADGSVVVRLAEAKNPTWVGEALDTPDRAWVLYQLTRRTYTPPAGESAWCNADNVTTESREARVLTLDVSDWPTVVVVADEPLLDAEGDPLVAHSSHPIAASRSGTHAAWVDGPGDGRLHVARLQRVALTGSAAGEETLAIDWSTERAYASPQAYFQWGCALSHDGSYAAACSEDSRGTRAIVVLNLATGAWTTASVSKYAPYGLVGSFDFAPPPGGN